MGVGVITRAIEKKCNYISSISKTVHGIDDRCIHVFGCLTNMLNMYIDICYKKHICICIYIYKTCVYMCIYILI